jgi:hypothetical protein
MRGFELLTDPPLVGSQPGENRWMGHPTRAGTGPILPTLSNLYAGKYKQIEYSEHAQAENPQGNEEAISLDGKRQGQTSSVGNESSPDSHITEAEAESAGDNHSRRVHGEIHPAGAEQE